MNDSIVKSNDHKKVIQLYTAINNGLNIKHIERILQKKGDINAEISSIGNENWIDYNVLHLAFEKDNIELFKLLLDYNANFTRKSHAGRTVIHRAIEDDYYKENLSSIQFKNCYIDLVLCAQLKSEDPSNLYSNYGLSHFHAACMTNNTEAVIFLLKNGISVNEAVHEDSPIFAGFTPIHFAARYSCLETVKILLKYRANIHLTNTKGKTALNILMERMINQSGLEDLDEKMLDLLVKHDVIINKNISSIDIFGLSNLHISCFLKDTSFVKNILERTLDIDQTVNMTSPFCPGYTPLHFAALFNINIVELLVKKKANLDTKDAKGVTAFDLCLQRYKPKDINFIFSSKQEWANIVLSDNKTNLLDLVSAMQSTEQLLNFIDNTEFDVQSIVPIDSPLWPGYTLLHIAVIFCEQTANKNVESQWIDDCQKIEECLNEGVKITTPGANGYTALHLAFYLQKRRTVELLLKHHWTTENPQDCNNLSHFHIACAAGDQDAVERFLCGDVYLNDRVESFFEWQTMCHTKDTNIEAKSFFINSGSTALHINVANGNTVITEMLLDEGANIEAEDSNGFTPIHRLLTSCSSNDVGNLLLNIDGLKDFVGPCGLSYLHVACHLENINAIQKFLESGSDINASITYTNNTNYENDETLCRKLVDPYGDLSQEPLSFLSPYVGFAPLHFSMLKDNFEVNCFLIQKGADIFAECHNRSITSPIHQILKEMPSYCKILISILMNNDSWRKRVKEEFGLTMLHVACCAINTELCKDLIDQGEDVNAQIHMTSPVWAGYTPLHFVASKASMSENENNAELEKIFKLLLNNGADFTVSNSRKDTALHLLGKGSNRSYADSFYVTRLLRSIKDFSVNPTDNQGVSFFHIACMKKDLSAVEGYLKHGVDVNQTVNNFSDKYSGCSSLHLAAGYRPKSFKSVESQVQTIDLLLKNNADVQFRDAFDNTSLHEAARCESSREDLLQLIISETADLNAENLLGETALEILLKTGNAKWNEINYFLDRGCSLNSFNPVTKEGYISRIFTNSKTREEYALDNPTLRQFIDSPRITEVAQKGRTCLHNLVCMSYFYIYDQVQLVKEFVDHGCDIDQQDDEGRTALHLATLFKNNRGVFALIKNGADINICDNYGKTAFSYAFEEGFPRNMSSQEDYHDPEHVIKNIASHVYKMMLCKLDVNKLNRQLLANSSEKYPLWERVIDRWNYSKERAKKAKIGSTSMTLYDFLFKVDAETAYPKMSISERQEIDDFFEKISDYKCCAIDYLVKHKINKGYGMLQLLSHAAASLSIIAQRQLPDTCSQVILKFLSSADMKNLVSAIL